MQTFEQVLQKYRDISFSERDKGYRFERLMQSFLKTYPKYISRFTSIWLWNEFPSRADFGVGDKDLGIDLVAPETAIIGLSNANATKKIIQHET
jgi:predicted helicase